MFRNWFVSSRRRLPWSRERGLFLTASGRARPAPTSRTCRGEALPRPSCRPLQGKDTGQPAGLAPNLLQ